MRVISSSVLLLLAVVAFASVSAQSPTPCTIQANCSGNAVEVQGNSATGCICTCANLWYGPQCEACPNGVDTSKNCGVCLPGYGDYPNCALICTVQANCSGHASAVQGDARTGCICTCDNQWVGSNCQVCPEGFDASKNCGTCAKGFSGYPFCAPTCTIAASCSGHATNVTGNAKTGCECTCRNQWYGGNCGACPAGVDAAKDCNECLPGYSGFPFCALTCTVAGNCTNHATMVEGNSRTGCLCTCRNQWYGASCQACPPGVDASQDCAVCLPGYDNYPFCAAVCTNAKDCSGNAVNVTGNAQVGCTCTCRNQWVGGNCGYCPPNFDRSQDCGACSVNYENYPYCTPVPPSKVAKPPQRNGEGHRH